MRFKQVNPVKTKATHRYRNYSHEALTETYISVKEKDLSVAKASRMYQVPMQTLRDRVIGKIHIDTVTTGRAPVLNLDEEQKLISHLKEVAKVGYGYTRQEVVDIATDYAVRLGKRSKENPLTLRWFVHFAKRWPEIKVLRPQSLEFQRALCASSEVVDNYFHELELIFNKYNLYDKPHLIFNVDEKGVSPEHRPPYIVSGTDVNAQAVTAGKGKTTTIIGCGSASGMAIPPFFVFAGKRLVPELMVGSSPGARGAMSESGWSNSDIFCSYLKEHFIKYAPRLDPGEHILLLLDGHSSHVSLDLIEWAKENSIILFVLPAHTSHLLQPMDVGCYGPFQRMFHAECHKLTRQSVTAVTRHDICGISCKVYSKALCSENLHSAFRKTGIYPLDRSVISSEATAPAEVFNRTVDDVEGPPASPHDQVSVMSRSPSTILTTRMETLLEMKRQYKDHRKPRRHIGKVVSGKPITEERVKEKICEYKKTQNVVKKTNNKEKHVGKKQKSKVKEGVAVAGPSHVYVSDSENSMDTDISDEEKCCVCNQFTPSAVKDSVSIIFVKWAQCDGIQCGHWVHLKYCTKVSVIRLGDKFYCPHCPADTEE